MNKSIIYATVGLVVLVGGFFVLNTYIYNEKQAVTGFDHKNAEYIIDGQRVKLVDGIAETEAAPGSATKVVTKYFGNEVQRDLNGDGKEDMVFILTQEPGGSGTFFYVVAAVSSETGYVGSQAVLLGDRIAPQTTEFGNNDIVIVNYADRNPGEDFSVQPSLGKSIHLKLDPAALQFGEVAQDFEGEADPSRMTLSMKTWKWISALYNDEREVKPAKADAFTLTFGADGKFTATTDCNQMGGSYTTDAEKIEFKDIFSTKMFCEGSQETVFAELLTNSTSYHFTSKGELILDQKFDSGSVVFR